MPAAAAVIALLAIGLVLAVVRLVVEVRGDGYGHRAGPPSHPDWSREGLPSQPYASR